MCCKKCALNPLFGNKIEIRKDFQQLFTCQKPFCGLEAPNDIYSRECMNCAQKEKLRLCTQDLWVLHFLGQADSFATSTCYYTLDTLVFSGCSDLLCELFRIAGYSIRKELWFRMVSLHSDRIYLLDSLFERISLPPLEGTEINPHSMEYQHAILRCDQL
jgi:hypothetical protein